ncbi:copper chaperone PCu(A)C [Mycobacterium sp. SMC-4]|uniref:copper chaperone PCu(A)C n=1 Tax=Mycobacterium sp. SMC-4 TaxID=2857059 RepID=UPI0037C6525F
MKNNMFGKAVGGLLVTGVLLGAACGSADESPAPMAEGVTISDQWASAADSGMTAVFGSVANTGPGDARIVGGSSPQAGHVEVHEVVPDATGTMIMRQIDGGLTVPAGGTRELIPGGDHLMLMDLTQPLLPGADVEVTVEFEDGSTLPVIAQVRDFAGGHEEYSPGAGAEGAPHHHG